MLHRAVKEGNLLRAREALESHEDVNQADKTARTPLMQAVRKDRPDLVELFLAHCADPDVADLDGWTALHFAAWIGGLQCVLLLQGCGANHNSTTNEGATPLHLAARQGHGDVIRILLQGGADPSIYDEDGQTALHIATERGHYQPVEALLSCATNADAVDEDGWTALHVASHYGHTALVELLLSNGSDRNKRDEEGDMPVDKARKSGHNACVELLLSRLPSQLGLGSLQRETVSIVNDQLMSRLDQGPLRRSDDAGSVHRVSDLHNPHGMRVKTGVYSATPRRGQRQQGASGAPPGMQPPSQTGMRGHGFAGPERRALDTGQHYAYHVDAQGTLSPLITHHNPLAAANDFSGGQDWGMQAMGRFQQLPAQPTGYHMGGGMDHMSHMQQPADPAGISSMLSKLSSLQQQLNITQESNAYLKMELAQQRGSAAFGRGGTDDPLGEVCETYPLLRQRLREAEEELGAFRLQRQTLDLLKNEVAALRAENRELKMRFHAAQERGSKGLFGKDQDVKLATLGHKLTCVACHAVMDVPFWPGPPPSASDPTSDTQQAAPQPPVASLAATALVAAKPPGKIHVSADSCPVTPRQASNAGLHTAPPSDVHTPFSARHPVGSSAASVSSYTATPRASLAGGPEPAGDGGAPGEGIAVVSLSLGGGRGKREAPRIRARIRPPLPESFHSAESCASANGIAAAMLTRSATAPVAAGAAARSATSSAGHTTATAAAAAQSAASGSGAAAAAPAAPPATKPGVPSLRAAAVAAAAASPTAEADGVSNHPAPVKMQEAVEAWRQESFNDNPRIAAAAAAAAARQAAKAAPEPRVSVGGSSDSSAPQPGSPPPVLNSKVVPSPVRSHSPEQPQSPTSLQTGVKPCASPQQSPAAEPATASVSIAKAALVAAKARGMDPPPTTSAAVKPAHGNAEAGAGPMLASQQKSKPASPCAQHPALAPAVVTAKVAGSRSFVTAQAAVAVAAPPAKQTVAIQSPNSVAAVFEDLSADTRASAGCAEDMTPSNVMLEPRAEAGTGLGPVPAQALFPLAVTAVQANGQGPEPRLSSDPGPAIRSSSSLRGGRATATARTGDVGTLIREASSDRGARQVAGGVSPPRSEHSSASLSSARSGVRIPSTKMAERISTLRATFEAANATPGARLQTPRSSTSASSSAAVATRRANWQRALQSMALPSQPAPAAITGNPKAASQPLAQDRVLGQRAPSGAVQVGETACGEKEEDEARQAAKAAVEALRAQGLCPTVAGAGGGAAAGTPSLVRTLLAAMKEREAVSAPSSACGASPTPSISPVPSVGAAPAHARSSKVMKWLSAKQAEAAMS